MLAGTLEIGQLKQMQGSSLQPGETQGRALIDEPGTLEIEDLKLLEK